jgi:hypothetical protein
MSAVPFKVVLLLGDPELAHEAGRALWVVFDEVEKLYNLDQRRCVFERYAITSEGPHELGFDPGGREHIEVSKPALEELWTAAGGRYSGTVDQAELAQLVRRKLRLKHGAKYEVVVVTDRDLTPPPDWRYILWDCTTGGWVVSIAAMDPAYWGIRDPSRAEAIKRRARAACMSVVGQALGLSRCDNEQCFLFSNVDSVTRLDLMNSLGSEHAEVIASESLGYAPNVEDPAIEQEILSREDLELGGWAPLS